MKDSQQKPWLTYINTSVFVVILCLGCFDRASAQWANTGPNSISNTNPGNVGIGTTAPDRKLSVNNSAAQTEEIISVYRPAAANTSAGRSRVAFEFRGDAYSDNPNTYGWSLNFANSVLAKIVASPKSYTELGSTNAGLHSSLGFFVQSAGHGGLLERMTIFGNGNVGIGTSNPTYKLDVQNPGANGAIRSVNETFGIRGLITEQHSTDVAGAVFVGSKSRGTLAAPTAVVSGDFGGFFSAKWFDGTSYVQSGAFGFAVDGPVSAGVVPSRLSFMTSTTSGDGATGHGVERMTILSGGNVGIGTASPGAGYRLDVQGGPINSSGGLCINGDCKTAWSQLGGSSQWTTGTGGTINYGGGNVGIGSNAPGAKLDVTGTIRAGNGDTNIGNHPVYGTVYTAFWRQGADYSVLTDGSNTFLNSPTASGNIYFRSANADRMVLQAGSGNLGIGTPSPTSKLHVAGNANVTGDLVVGGNLAAKYQDVAEWVDSSQTLEPGTVVVLDSGKSNQVVASTQNYDSRVAGVISLRPGLTLGERGEGRVLVATTGRVRVKVTTSNGPINIGDLLVTSDKEGVAMKSLPIEIGGVQIHRPGTLIGKALEPLVKGGSEILVLLSLQ